MPQRISIFIPVYRESEFLEPLLENLLADPFPDKEIFVVVDAPTEKSLSLATKFSGTVRFLWNGERKGKANVLNEVVNLSSGDILMFLDSDVLVDGRSGEFLKKTSEAMNEAEIIEVRKDIIKDSFLARITSYDYLSFSFANWFFSRRLGKCPGLNGAAFAIKRQTFTALGGFKRVLVEDLDIATRAFLNNVTYKFLEDVAVHTKTPSTWGAWFNQRKRWGIGSALWFKEYFRDLVRMVRQHPGVLLPSLLFVFPCLPFFLATILTPDELYVKAIYLSLLVLSTQASLFLPPTAFTSTSLAVFRNLLLMIGSLGTYAALFYALARKMGSAFNPFDFTLFYLIYSPIWFLIIIASLTKVYLRPKGLEVDWKT